MTKSGNDSKGTWHDRLRRPVHQTGGNQVSEQKPESIPWLGECATCGYGIRLVDDVGWIHAEVPDYDGHECDEARYEANR